MILYLFLILLLAVILWRLQILFKLILLKLKHGNKIEIHFSLLGFIDKIRKAEKLYGDPLYYEKRLNNQSCQIKAFNGIRNRLIFIIFKQDHLKFLINNPDLYKKFIPEYLELFLSQGLIFQEGQDWKKSRLLLSKHFEFSQIKASLPIVKQKCQEHLNNKENNDIIKQSSLVAGEVVTKIFFGIESPDNLSLQVQSIIEQLTIFRRNNLLLFILRESLIPSALRKQFAFKEEIKLNQKTMELKACLKNMIDQKKQHISNDFISAFIPDLEAGKITQELVIHQYITLLFAGMDTTSHLFGACCYALARNQNIQDRLRSEIKQIVKNFDDLASEDFAKIPYLQAVIDESLRLYTPAPNLIERIALQDHHIGDVHIPKGSLILPNLSLNNYTQYEDPFTFNPDRLKSTHLEPFQFIPFSAGPRNCIGQHLSLLELKTMLIFIIMNYRIHKLIDVQWTFKFVYAIRQDKFITLEKLD